MAKQDITQDKTLEWNRFAKIPVNSALPGIYAEASEFSLRARKWYWQSIRTKRFWSTGARVVSYLFAVFGVVAPLVAAIGGKPELRLVWTQAGVVAFAVAGLIQVGDRAFGWSSGWMRYVTTVTGMERRTLQFELDWTQHLLLRAGEITDADVRPLFDIAKRFQTDIEKRRSDETDLWVGEFNTGLAALNEMVRARKEASEKSSEATRTVLETHTKRPP